MSGLIKGSRTLLSTSAFSLFQHLVLVETYEENLASHRYVVVKERHILIVFSDNCVYSSLILYQNSTSCHFLKISWNVESETISMIFLYYAALESTGLSWALSGFLFCLFVSAAPCSMWDLP